MADCIFCQIISGKIPADKVYEDNQLIAFKDIHPKAKVHLLVVPKKHVPSLKELDKNDEALIAHMMLTTPKIAAEAGLEGFRSIINTGQTSGQEVFHLHLHILGGGGKLPGF